MAEGRPAPGHAGACGGAGVLLGVKSCRAVVADGEPASAIFRIAAVFLKAEAAIGAPEDIDAAVIPLKIDGAEHGAPGHPR